MVNQTDVHSRTELTPDEAEAGIGVVVDAGADRQLLRSRGVTGFELALLTLLAMALLIPGIWRYSLVDPWETHYAEVGRRMLQDNDLVRTQWQNEGFKSKPVLTFWMIAASMRSMGIAKDGGFSGEMTSSDAVMFAVRLPFVLFGVLGLLFLWWMLARLVNRRVAWLAFLVVGTTPFYFMVARQAITDMPMVACLIGALSCFAMSTHAGNAPLRPILGRRINAFHLFLIALVAFVGWQLVYYAIHFASVPHARFMPRFPLLDHQQSLWMLLTLLGLALVAFVIWTVWLQPTRYVRQVYMYWFYTLVFVSVLAKGIPAVGIAGAVCFFYIALTNQWRLLWRIELFKGMLLALVIVVPWHFAMWVEEGPAFIREYVIGHNFKRAGDGMHGDRGTFNYFMSQIGVGMWPWIALVPAALASVMTRATASSREGRVRLLIGIWAIFTVAFFSAITTKFHHYILPAIPALGVLVAFWIDDLLSGKVSRVGAFTVAAIAIALLIMRDLMHEQKQLIELFIYRYDRPWPSNPPWEIDLSDGFLIFGLLFAFAFACIGVRKLRRVGLGMLFVSVISFTYWHANVYMNYAGMHWGQRTAVQAYYQQRQIHGLDITYYSPADVAAEWSDSDGTIAIDTVVPEHISPNQPMTIHIEVRANNEALEHEIDMVGRVSRIDDSRIWVAIPRTELAGLQPIIGLGRGRERARKRPWRAVNADRLIAWQLYWRGENFWSSDEIWARSADMKTAFKATDNKQFLEYLGDDSRVGRRFFLITEAGRARNLRNILPTKRAKETYEIVDRSSNKFTMVSFTL